MVANLAILGMSCALIAGLGVHEVALQKVKARAAESSKTYTNPVQHIPAPRPTTVAFMGDSFTAGARASTRGHRWTSVLAEKNNWLELNYGKGGTNYGSQTDLPGGEAYSDRLTDLIISRPDIVIISSAGNGISKNQQPAIRKTLQHLRSELPDAQIITISPFYRAYDKEMPTRFVGFAESIQNEVEDVGGHYIDIGNPLYGKTNVLAEDGLHPNDAGYKLIAEAIDGAIH